MGIIKSSFMHCRIVASEDGVPLSIVTEAETICLLPSIASHVERNGITLLIDTANALAGAMDVHIGQREELAKLEGG